jgi:hypothetical protein
VPGRKWCCRVLSQSKIEMTQLLSLVKSDRPGKKWKATFNKDGHSKTTHFGDSSAQDYTQHHDEDRRANYRSRHKKDLKTGDPTRAGYLSYYLLWGDSANLRSNLEDYRKRYNLG